MRDLTEASRRYGTVNNILDIDVQNDTVRTPGSLSRNLRRVRQGLDLIRAIFQNFVSTEYVSLASSSLFNYIYFKTKRIVHLSREIKYLWCYFFAIANDILFYFRDYSLKEAASTAYAQVCAPYHSWAVRTAVSAGMCALPTRDQLLLKLNETGVFTAHFIAYYTTFMEVPNNNLDF